MDETHKEVLLNNIAEKIRHAIVPLVTFRNDISSCGTTDELKSLESKTLKLMHSTTQLRDHVFALHMDILNRRTVDSSRMWQEPDPED